MLKSMLKLKREVSIDITLEEAKALYPVMKAEAEAEIKKENKVVKSEIRKSFQKRLDVLRQLLKDEKISENDFDKEIADIQKKCDIKYKDNELAYDENIVEYKIYTIYNKQKDNPRRFAGLHVHFNTANVQWERMEEQFRYNRMILYQDYVKDPEDVINSLKNEFICDSFFKDRRINTSAIKVKVNMPKRLPDDEEALSKTRVSVSFVATGSILVTANKKYDYEVWEAKWKGQYWCSMYVPLTIRIDAEKKAAERYSKDYKLWKCIRDAITRNEDKREIKLMLRTFSKNNFQERMEIAGKAEDLEEKALYAIRDVILQGKYRDAIELITKHCNHTSALSSLITYFKDKACKEADSVMRMQAIMRCEHLKPKTPTKDVVYEYKLTIKKTKSPEQ